MNRLSFAMPPGVSARTTVCEALFRQLLSASRAFYLDADRPGEATVYLQSTSGVLLPGDEALLSISCATGAQARVVGATSTVVHGGRDFAPAKQHVAITCAAHSTLVYSPSPIVVLGDATIESSVSVDLVDDAVAIVVDGFYGHDRDDHIGPHRVVANSIEVRRDGKLLWLERSHITHDTLVPQGLVAILGHANTALEAALDAALNATKWPPDTHVGIGQLPNSAGLIARFTAAAPAALALVDRVVGVASKTICSADGPLV